ncbi:diguanylate cyclase domain-containing protein [Limnoraphis robusta]|uniref:diguanylate cyclase domain-containing protein n=1 Tax=Limnoraphis robusta TaxID=1118279 RepID=UPI002B1FD8D3|nr:diguanylate cyclase [Limnoraphis robusta]MEA5499690.1 diguanylate cyclase [Limnoraphis robusta BA-68 BA1]
MKQIKQLIPVHRTAFQYLNTPIWLYDTQNGQVQWANDAALQLFNADNIKTLNYIFNIFLRSKITYLLQALEPLKPGQKIQENWRIDFPEKTINLRCYCSVILTENGQLAILVEAHIEHNQPIEPESLRLVEAWRHTNFMLSLYTLDGELLLQNPAAQNCYGNLSPNGKNNHRSFFNSFLAPAVEQEALDCINKGKIFSVETQVKTDKGLCWHKIEARKTYDPVTGNYLILVSEKDINDRKKSEEKLRESQHFLQKLTNTVPQILYIFDLSDNKSLYLNQRSIEILGYSPEEICTWEPERLINHFHPEDRHLCYSLPHRFQHLKDDEILSSEYRFRHKNGEWRWLNSREIVFQRDAKGKPLQILGSVTDISSQQAALRERKQAEIALQSLSNRLQHLLTSSPGIIYSCQPQGNYGVSYISENVKTVLGFDAETFLNNPHYFWYSRIHPDDLATITNAIQRLFQQGEITLEYRFLHSDQTYHWIYDQAKLLKNALGQPTEIVGYIIDISDRKRSELALKHQKEVLQAIFDHIPIMLACFNSDGKTQLINRELEQVLGWSLAQWQQQNLLLQCYPNPHDYQQVIAHMQAADRQWKDFQTRTETGEIVETSWTNIRLSDGSRIGIGQDITARKQNEKRLREQAQREQLITLVTQRIRQSLNLDDILETTVAEIRQLLQTERVLIYRFEPDKSGIVIAESVDESWVSLRGKILFDEGLADNTCINAYTHGRIQNTPDIYNSGLPDCYIQLLAQFQVRANLVIPILHGEELWGLLVAQHCSQPRLWQTTEIELLHQLADQVAIAISQSELYQYAQYQAQREQALNEVIQAIRNSLELNTIFSTASHEIARLLYVDWVHIVQYFPEEKIWLNVGEYCRYPNFIKALGTEITDDENQFFAQLKQLKIVQIADISQAEDKINCAYARTYPGSWLLIPIHSKSSFWGSLNLIRNPQHTQWQSSEIELARTVANQLAIAIQQSQLYQQLQHANEELQHLATHDQLTQLANRRYFDEYLTQEWQRLTREQGLLSLILCDVDYFKRYNDTYGHLAGDECLTKVAQVIRHGVKRPADLAARYGGEEFVIILPNTDSQGAIQVVQTIQADIFQLHIPHESSSASSQITLSFGIASLYPTTVSYPEILIKKADLALYQAKENGRNCYYLSDND